MHAALIAVSDTPLRMGSDYLLNWDESSISGRLRSIGKKLPSSLAAQSSELLLHPKELASVEIEISPPSLAAMPVRRMRRMVVVEPGTEQTVGTGLVIPDGHGEEGHSHQEDAPDAARGFTVWLTGFSGAGKTTIALQLYDRLRPFCDVELLDADIVRTYLCKDLGYSREDRNENVRRLGFVAGLLNQRGTIVLVTAISPYRAGRDELRRSIGRFMEVYVNAPIATCEQRDVKGLYKKARAGELRSFTGIDDPYEPPLAPEVECHTDRESIETSVGRVIAAVEQKLNRRL